jgi:hypothetical protein
MGGIGTWDMLIKFNAHTGTEDKIFAAGMPLAGADYDHGSPNPPTSVVEALKNVPIWAIHGAGDTQVPLTWDRAMYAAEQAAGGLMRYTEDANLGHDVWDSYYTTAASWDWLYGQTTTAGIDQASKSSASPDNPVISIVPASGAAQAIDGPTVGTIRIADDSFSLTGGGVATAVLGGASESLRFISMSSVSLTGGAGKVSVTANVGENSFTVGSGPLAVEGGSGAASYFVHAGAGALTINDFSAAKGDTLTFDASLKTTMKIGGDGQGGTAITFGGAVGTLDIKGVATVPTSAIHWS